MNGVEGRYMEGWKISEIIYMFTWPLKCLERGPRKIRQKRINSKRHGFNFGRVRLGEVGKWNLMPMRGDFKKGPSSRTRMTVMRGQGHRSAANNLVERKPWMSTVGGHRFLLPFSRCLSLLLLSLLCSLLSPSLPFLLPPPT